MIVCSVGDPAVNSSQEWSSAALPAGDLASQPGVLAVAACEADGSWYRHRRGSPYNRLGPSVALTAPGDWHDLGAGLGADDSSLAAAVVAGIAALVRGRNRTLLAGEIGELLRTTARFPDRVDAGAGPEAGRYNRRDRLGHNFKVGHGRVDALGALLAAGDPVAAALLLTLDEEVGPSLALAWERGIAWDAPIAVAYRAVRGELARRFSCHLELREALLWLTRHLGAIAGASRHSWLAGEGDHGALVERILDLLELVAALPGIPGIQDWAAAARVTIEESGGPGVVGWIGQLLPAVEAAR